MLSQDQKFELDSQNTFSGGMNLVENDTALTENEYREAFNCFNRYGRLDQFNDAIEIASSITGLKQGLYGFGQYTVLFCSGLAYYKHYTESNFTRITSFAMSNTAVRLYAEFVPASYINLVRKMPLIDPADAGSGTDNTAAVIFFNEKVAPNPAAMIVNDGTNQPQIIYYDSTVGMIVSRETKKYSDWNNTPSANAREYVPIGLDLMFLNGILFMVSPDRKTLYRSVTGRPLDFVVNVSDAGEKAVLEADGGADSSNYSVGFDDITAINSLSNDTFLISTKTPKSYIIQIDRNFTVWGEPTFNVVGSFSGSALNQFCKTDILGETALITDEGILSFNPSATQNVENKNNVFSLKISKVFDGLLQDKDRCAIGVFDDKVYFSVNTIYGPVLAIYDKLRQCWSSFYSSENGIKIKQFVSLIPNAREFYGITYDDKVFKFFGGEDKTLASVTTKAFNTDNPLIEQKLNTLSCVLFNTLVTGSLVARAYVDDISATTITKVIKQKAINNVPFEFNIRPLIGFKVSYNISWTGGGSLTHIYHTGDVINLKNPAAQAKQYV